MNTLDHLSKSTKIVTDTAFFKKIAKYQPTDSTTNPTLIFAAIKDPEYKPYLDEAIAYGQKFNGNLTEKAEQSLDRILFLFGSEILKIVPGRVSVEIDARLSFDTKKQVEKARKIVGMFEEAGISKERILIKLATTWEGAQACKILESEHGIHCNMTLIFGFAQIRIAVEAGATLVSPFVGRVTDWFAKNKPEDEEEGYDIGVECVKEFYSYIKNNGYRTEIMGASFRTVGQILSLTGCDLLTISPSLLEELSQMNIVPGVNLKPEVDDSEPEFKDPLIYEAYLWMQNENECATKLLKDGIDRFIKDTEDLENLIIEKL